MLEREKFITSWENETTRNIFQIVLAREAVFIILNSLKRPYFS